MKVEIELSKEDEHLLQYYLMQYYRTVRATESGALLMGDYSKIIHDIVQIYLKPFYGN